MGIDNLLQYLKNHAGNGVVFGYEWKAWWNFNFDCCPRSVGWPWQPGILPRHHWGWDGGMWSAFIISNFQFSYFHTFMLPCRCVLGRGTHSWRSGTKQEWFYSGSTEFKFPTKFSTWHLVTRFKWRTATIGTDTCMCLKVPWSQKRYSENCPIQIWNDDNFKSGKAVV